MRPGRSRLAAIVIAALVISLTGFALLLQQRWHATPVTLDAAAIASFWNHGMSYEQFVESDTARRAQWLANDARAEAAVAAALPSAREIVGTRMLLVVAENWCGDAVNSVPYLAKLAERDSAIELRLLRTADAAALLRAHRLEGRTATPLVLVLDDQLEERGVWIERPKALRAVVAELEGKVSRDSLRTRVRSWYANDAGGEVLKEVLALMKQAPVGRSCG